MKYIVYSTRNTNNSISVPFDIVCETNREEVAKFAMDKEAEQLGPTLIVIKVTDGKITQIIPGKKH